MTEKLLGNIASFALGGIVAGIFVCIWKHDIPNLAGFAVIFVVVAAIRAAIEVPANR